MIPRLLSFLASFLIFSADRATKFYIDSNFSLWDTYPVIPGFFNIIHSENRGMAFSLLAGSQSPWRDFLLMGVSSAVLVVVAVMLFRAVNNFQRVALALVFGGALGNLYDRIIRGSVTDFLDFYVGAYHWPTFNIADAAITCGAILLALEILGWAPSKVPTPKES